MGNAEQQKKRIPVILDTDIGGDIDDTWALAMMLLSPELDIKLITTVPGTATQAKIVAKMLETAGRTDIPIGMNACEDSFAAFSQAAWTDGYDLGKYAGKIYKNGAQAIVETIMGAEGEVSVVAIGVATNIALALDMRAEIAQKSRFVGMYGSIYKGYENSDTISAEANVSKVGDLRKVFAAPWDITITPLDTCGLVVLKGDKYQKVLNCEKPIIKALMENYKAWLGKDEDNWYGSRSSTLFDTVAVYLAFSEALLRIEGIGLRITDDAYTLVDEGAKKIRCAISWDDLGAYEDFLVERLTG